MKIIAEILNGDLIIQVSQVEWGGLQNGINPDDEDRILLWGRSEVYRGLSQMKLPGLNWRRRLFTPFKLGQFDGTWASLEKFDFYAPYIAHRGRERLRNIARQQN